MSGLDGHSSGTTVASRLARPTRTTTRKPVCRPPCGTDRSSLLGLAPGGVCRAVPVAGDAVRSCRTLSPLPAAERPAVCFLWHFPWGRPRRALPGTVFPWSPDFPPAPMRRRPSGCLTTLHPMARPAPGQRTAPRTGTGRARDGRTGARYPRPPGDTREQVDEHGSPEPAITR